MLPSAIYFIAYCPLLTLSLPTGWERKQQITRLHGNNFIGQSPTAHAHCPLFKLKAYRRFQPVGSGQNTPLLLRSNAELHPSGVEASASQTSSQNHLEKERKPQ